MRQYQLTFIDLALKRDALRFGTFALKSGRESPYFFNAGLFSDGEALATLGACYAAAIVHSGIRFDMVFGPAYKGIALAVATVMALSGEHGRSVPCAFNRKEAKEHGEGGNVVGAPLEGRVLVVDDVITARSFGPRAPSRRAWRWRSTARNAGGASRAPCRSWSSSRAFSV